MRQHQRGLKILNFVKQKASIPNKAHKPRLWENVQQGNMRSITDIVGGSFCQTPVLGLGLGVDFVLPLSQEEQQEPTPKEATSRHARTLRFGMLT